MKIKQIRKKIIHSYKPINRFDNILNNYAYKNILFLKSLQNYYTQIKKFDIFLELEKQNYFYHFNDLMEFHKKEKFYQQQIKDTLEFYIDYIKGNIKQIDLDKIYFLCLLNIVENIPLKKVISEWDYISLIDMQKDYLKIKNISDLKNLLSFKFKLPNSKNIPIFEKNSIDIRFDNIIVEITTLNRINYVPSVNKLLKFKNSTDIEGIVINPRFELLKKINFETMEIF